MVSNISSSNYTTYLYKNDCNIYTGNFQNNNSKVDNELNKMCERYENTMFSFKRGTTKIENSAEFQMLAQFNALGSISDSDNPFETAARYSSFTNSYDWDSEWDKYLTEWNKYLNSRGCKNEEELAILDSTMWNTMEQLKNYVQNGLSYVMTNLTRRIPEMSSSVRIGSDVINNVSLEALAEYSNSINSNIDNTVIATQKLLNQVNNKTSGLDKSYIEELSTSLDSLLEMLAKEREEGGNVDFNEYQQQYVERMLGRYKTTI